MSQRTFRKIPMAGLVLAIVLSAPLPAQEADPQMMANLVIQVQELQDEVRTLRGMMEEQARELENLKRRQRDQYLDLDQRLSEVSSAQPLEPAGYAGSESVTAGAAAQGTPVQDVPEVRETVG
ncbi:MAG: YbgF trimerization domain-containing protein, partial [Lysobacterales bacterium]